jgi:hypothetical protein
MMMMMMIIIIIIIIAVVIVITTRLAFVFGFFPFTCACFGFRAVKFARK